MHTWNLTLLIGKEVDDWWLQSTHNASRRQQNRWWLRTMQRWVEAGKLWAPAAIFMLEFGLCVSLTLATMIQLWSMVSGFAMRIVKPSEVLNCNQFGAKLLSKDAIDRLWSFVFLPCIYMIFFFWIHVILCYIRLYAVQPTSICLYCMSRTSQLSFHWQWLEGV